MSTKNNPGSYNCYANADPDEPMFVLLGRDPTAALLVRLWASLRRNMTSSLEPEKFENALRCAEELEAWACKIGKNERVAESKATYIEHAIVVARASEAARASKIDKLLRKGDVVRHRGSGRIGTVTGFAHDGTIDVMVDETGPYKQEAFERLVPEPA